MTYEERYEGWTRRFKDNPQSVKALFVVNKALTYLGYIAYPALLIWALLYAPQLLMRLIIVPAISFAVVSVYRHVQDSPRPYEMAKIQPLIHKDTVGKSFPSRHIFSMTMIAMCYAYVSIPLGCILGVCSIIMAVIRVLGGIHFPKDVVAGALIAVVLAVIGLWVIPWP